MDKGIDTNDVTQEQVQDQTQADTKAQDDFAADQVSQIAEMMSTFTETKSEESEEKSEDTSEEKEASETETDETEDKEEKSEDPRDAKISALEAQIAELKNLITNPEKKSETETQAQTDTEDSYFKSKLDEVQKDLVSEFVADEEYEAVFEKREKLNEVLKRVQSDTLQGVFRSIPKIIASIIPQHVMLYSKTMEFYKANPDLIEHRTKVGELIDETSAKNPGWDLDKVLTFVGGKYGDENDIGEVRKVLKLKKKAEKVAENSNIRRPSFAKPSHVKNLGKEVKLTGIEKEIADMVDAIK